MTTSRNMVVEVAQAEGEPQGTEVGVDVQVEPRDWKTSRARPK